MQIQAGDGTLITPTLGTVMKFDLNSFKQIVVTGVQTPTYNSATCSCDNVVLETHYKVYFTEVSANNFIITSVVVDVVYGTMVSTDCKTPKHFQLKTSLNYLQ